MVYEDETTLAFLDIHPVTAGHTLVIPKSHFKNIFDVPPGEWIAVTAAVQILAIRLEKSLGSQGINIMMNNREHAGQMIDHIHVHVIPRFRGDGLKHWQPRDYRPGEVEAVLEKIRGVL